MQNNTPFANRPHIAFFGRRNAGKSSLVNAITGQNLSIVSEIEGTTTDPVYKAMELLPLGPVVIIDTPGFDDSGDLGDKRVAKARQVLNKTDLAILVMDASSGNTSFSSEKELVNLFKAKNVPYIKVLNKIDLKLTDTDQNPVNSDTPLPVSAKTGYNINLLKEKIAAISVNEESLNKRLVADLMQPLDLIVLVIPLDEAAPKGRLILPQQQVIRDILEAGAVAIAVKDSELDDLLKKLEKKPALVITDSQVFAQVSAIVPLDVPLTSFSVLFARYKGFLESAVKGVFALDSINDNDKVLICEGCTHHRQCDDIGTVKIPRMIKSRFLKEPQFSFCTACDYPDDLKPYKLIIHCGGCMLNEREMLYRKRHAEEQNIPFTNYGIVIAHIQGILKRSIEIFNLEFLNE